MRIVIDMQGAQTASCKRGIGRVTRSLTEAIIRRGGHEVHLALNALFPDAIDGLREQFSPLLPKGCIHVWQAVPPIDSLSATSRLHREWAAEIYAGFMAALRPDAVLVPTFLAEFEDNFYCDFTRLKGKCRLAAVLHDFIPLRKKHECLPTCNHAAKYTEKFRAISLMDVVLPVSSFVDRECKAYLPGIPTHILPLGADVVFCPGEICESTKERLYAALGISRNFILYVGGLDDRKNIKKLIQAYRMLPQELRHTFQLVIIGGNDALLVKKHIEYCNGLGLSSDEVRILGYVSDTQLRDLYRLCALFAFPSLDEGFGLPVLEAIKCGAPVICSSAASIPEILDCPEALFDPENVASICQKMEQGLTDEPFRQRLVQRAAERAPLFSWERCADVAVAAMEGTSGCQVAQWPEEEQSARVERICRQVGSAQADEKETMRLSEALARTFPTLRQPQLLVDIGKVAKHDDKTGIQRVVRGIALELAQNSPPGWSVRFVRPSERCEYYVYAHEAALQLFDYDDGLDGDVQIDYCQNDVYLGLDFTTEQVINHKEWLANMHRFGVSMYFVLHDIIPLIYPEYVSDSHIVLFKDWLKTITMFDGIACVSKTVCEEVKLWLSKNGLLRSNFEIVSFRNGADIHQTQPTAGMPGDAERILAHLRARPTFLMVSTIEPRKGHRQALAAMERLWEEGVDANLALVGKSGWKMEKFEATLRSHPELGKRLFWLRGISDEYLAAVYGASTAVLSASEAEGFGLSLVEGAYYHKPLILRDIPVFHEVAGENAFYFSGLEPQDLARALRQWLDAYARGTAPSSAGIRLTTWRESCQELLRAIHIPIGRIPSGAMLQKAGS